MAFRGIQSTNIISTEVGFTDPILILNKDGSSAVDVGFLGKIGATSYAGLVKDSSTDEFLLINSINLASTSVNSVDATDLSLVPGDLTAGAITATSFTGDGSALTGITDTDTTYSVGDGGLTQKNFTNTLKNKLDGIETNATADQTKADIDSLGIAASSITGALPAIDGSALTGISSGSSTLASLTDSTVSASDPAVDTNPSAVGHLWINSSSGESFVCTDVTTDDNTWTNIGDGTDGIGGGERTADLILKVDASQNSTAQSLDSTGDVPDTMTATHGTYAGTNAWTFDGSNDMIRWNANGRFASSGDYTIAIFAYHTDNSRDILWSSYTGGSIVGGATFNWCSDPNGNYHNNPPGANYQGNWYNLNEWYFHVIRYTASSGSHEIFVDGYTSAVSTTTPNFDVTGHYGDTAIGARNDGIEWYTGHISAAWWYDAPLTNAEIRTIYDEHKGRHSINRSFI